MPLNGSAHEARQFEHQGFAQEATAAPPNQAAAAAAQGAHSRRQEEEEQEEQEGQEEEQENEQQQQPQPQPQQLTAGLSHAVGPAVVVGAHNTGT